MTASPALPRIDYFAFGGTIASVRGNDDGAVPTLTAQDIADSVDGLDQVAEVRAHQLLLTPSPEITIADLVRLRNAIADSVADGAVGAVVTQGTDSIEETAFVMDLLWSGEEPIVYTGAMRNPSLPGADGPANLLSAVQVAASAQAVGTGVTVCLGDEIHAARYVHKSHTSSPSTFVSPGLGPIGWVSEGRPVVPLRPSSRSGVDVPDDVAVSPVALIRLGLDDDGRILGTLADLGYHGVVIEAFGGGHVPVAALPAVAELAAAMPVVLASRTGSGEVLTQTYRFAGSEIELLELGLIRAGALDGLKARLLLMLCLAAGQDTDAIAETFAAVSSTSGPIRA
ncbi:asparaginase [Gordonia hydrophobica]|uniref:Asparaginase n=1 Tax=Gordonia hydrophobica TaxID=40516 RepID=A0ABZ2U4V3_9ACTN|nr:asparaginase [Gordonia hydrophobica]MBM7368259.1 L-asparaginase [Gordonia hydrophobica]